MSVFSFDKSTGYVSLMKHPIDSGFPVTSTQLIELLEQSEFCEYEPISANIGKLFAQVANHQDVSLIVAKAVDASMIINIDEKHMLAQASITTAKGGALVSMEDAQQVLFDAGIKKGINTRALDAFLGQQLEQPAGSTYSAIIAHGRNPKNGTNAKFVRLCSTAQDRVLSPQATTGGKVDMKNLGAIITVKPGTPLMQRIEATLGEDGYTVFGDVIVAKPGQDFQLQPFEGTKIDPTNPNILIADCKGVPVAQPRGMRVDDVLCFDNVDVSTGHVDFDGSVIISGDIKDGMHVKANGDITVLGFVESGVVESNSAVTIMLGAIGRKLENNDAFTCRISALRTISIGYAQYCHIKSEQNLFIERQALHCDLSAKQLIRVGKASDPRGKIIGGNILDAMRIETGELGAPAGTKTRVSLAQNWFELREKQTQIADFQKKLSSKALDLKNAREKADKIPNPTQRKLYLDKIDANEQQLTTRAHNVQKQKALINKKIGQLLSVSRLKVNELMHPGVELKIAKECKQFSRIYPPHLVKLNEGKITQSF